MNDGQDGQTDRLDSPRGTVDFSPSGADLRIDRDGTWHYHGSPVTRKEMVCLFASVLLRDDDGSYRLVTPTETCPVTVEDTPFLAVRLYCRGCGPEAMLSFLTNVDEIVTVDILHPLVLMPLPEGGEPVPCVVVRDGLLARLNRPVYYELIRRAQQNVIQGAPRLGVWSCGLFFPLRDD